MHFLYLLSFLGSPLAAAFLARRARRSALIWALLCFLSPLAGLILYQALPYPRPQLLHDLLPILSGPVFLVLMLLLPPAKDRPKESLSGFAVSLVALAIVILAVLFTLFIHFPAQH